MSIADLPYCRSLPQIEEALAKPVAYALSGSVGAWAKIAALTVRHKWRAPIEIAKWQAQRNSDRRAARDFLRVWGVRELWSYTDRRTGFELLVFRSGQRRYIVCVGSNDPLDWQRNLTNREVGVAAYERNRDAVQSAIFHASTNEPIEIVALGHSRGGAIAQYIAIDWECVTRCVTFQSAAIPREWVEKSQRRPYLRSTHYLHPSDPVYPVSRRRCDGGLADGEVRWHGEKVRGFARIQAHLAMLSLFSESHDHSPPQL